MSTSSRLPLDELGNVQLASLHEQVQEIQKEVQKMQAKIDSYSSLHDQVQKMQAKIDSSSPLHDQVQKMQAKIDSSSFLHLQNIGIKLYRNSDRPDLLSNGKCEIRIINLYDHPVEVFSKGVGKKPQSYKTILDTKGPVNETNIVSYPRVSWGVRIPKSDKFLLEQIPMVGNYIIYVYDKNRIYSCAFCREFKDKFPKVIIHEKTCQGTGLEPEPEQEVSIRLSPASDQSTAEARKSAKRKKSIKKKKKRSKRKNKRASKKR
jgi:hypothetical protein